MNNRLPPDELSRRLVSAYSNACESIGRAATIAVLSERVSKLPPGSDLPSFQEPVAEARATLGLSPNQHLSDPWPSMRGEFSRHCSRYAVLAMVTACEGFLQRAYKYAVLGRSLSDGQVTGRISDLLTSVVKHVRRTTAEKLAWEAFELLELPAPAVPARACFSSIYALRNCLVHRGGLVGVEDIAEQSSLTAEWMHVAIEVSGTEVRTLPADVPPNEPLRMPIRLVTKAWHLGDSVELNAKDCQDIAFTLIAYIGQVGGEVAVGLKRLGFWFLPEDPRGAFQIKFRLEID